MSEVDKPFEISYETFRKIANRLDRKEFTHRRWGRRDAEKSRSPRGSGPLTSRPLERVEIDHFLCDVHLLVPYESGFHVQRPWLSVAIDHYSGAVLGYYISFAPPSSASVLALLRNAILPKQ